MTKVFLAGSLWNMKDDIYPLGIKFWVELTPEKTPKFQVFRCLGCIGDGGDSFIFETIKGWPKTMLIKNWCELSTSNFKPFLLPLDKIRTRYGEEY